MYIKTKKFSNIIGRVLFISAEDKNYFKKLSSLYIIMDQCHIQAHNSVDYKVVYIIFYK